MDRETECAQQWLYKKDIAFITVFGLQKQLDENIKLPNFADALGAILAEFRALEESHGKGNA
jgi:hypothetical protein